MGTESFFTIDVWTTIFTLGNLLIIYLLFKKFLFKRVQKILDDRQKMINDSINNAKEAEDAANAKKTEYESLLQNAKTESEDIIKSANRRAALESEKIIDDARSQAADIVKKGEKQIEMEKQQAYLDIKADVSEMAVSIASAVVEKEIDESKHAELIDRAIAQLGE